MLPATCPALLQGTVLLAGLVTRAAIVSRLPGWADDMLVVLLGPHHLQTSTTQHRKHLVIAAQRAWLYHTLRKKHEAA